MDGDDRFVLGAIVVLLLIAIYLLLHPRQRPGIRRHTLVQGSSAANDSCTGYCA